jgi:3'-phosphoadenosine 5'-phosphosulfate sulfotransferase (PAPS reductase)/FAD synthetase
MHVIIGNFGNHSLAVMQALIEKGLTDIHFVYVNTGWADPSWSQRITLCSDYAHKNGVQVQQLSALMSFSEMVLDRKQFPSQKFQWCASFLKGLVILNFLDEYDPSCEAIIVSGKRQCDSRKLVDLKEYEEESEFYQGRKLWYPLWQTENEEFLGLIQRTGFLSLTHPSLECSPCIHLHSEKLQYLNPQTVKRLDLLEKVTGLSMFQAPITQLLSHPPKNDKNVSAQRDLEQFDLGCGAPWACGE